MAHLSALLLVGTGIIIIVATAFVRRLLFVLSIPRARHDSRVELPKTSPSHMVVVLGSGGHTAEMMSLLRDIVPTRYIHRTYIVSSGDEQSAKRAFNIETTIQSKYTQSSVSKEGEVDSMTGKWDVKVVPRAREIHQSLYKTPRSSLSCLISCIATLRAISRTSIAAPFEFADVIIANGPATAVMVILASVLLKFFGLAPLHKMKIIYVESWARVKTLSLSGELLLWMGVCDEFFVQWEELLKTINGSTSSGRLLLKMKVPGIFVQAWEKLAKITGSAARKKVKWVGFLVE